jgi:hypothetical protein
LRRFNGSLPVSPSGPIVNPTTRQKSFLPFMNNKANRQGGRDPLSIATWYQLAIEQANKNRNVVLLDLLSGRIDLREVLQLCANGKPVLRRGFRISSPTCQRICHSIEDTSERRNRGRNIPTTRLLSLRSKTPIDKCTLWLYEFGFNEDGGVMG